MPSRGCSAKKPGRAAVHRLEVGGAFLEGRRAMDLSKAGWRKASRSSAEGDNCVELAAVPGVVALRDSKAPHEGSICLSREDFRRFARVVKGL
ncbi:DUF397 domain-containing protein [Spirillospora sp. NPDC127200]